MTPETKNTLMSRIIMNDQRIKKLMTPAMVRAEQVGKFTARQRAIYAAVCEITESVKRDKRNLDSH